MIMHAVMVFERAICVLMAFILPIVCINEIWLSICITFVAAYQSMHIINLRRGTLRISHIAHSNKYLSSSLFLRGAHAYATSRHVRVS